MFAMRKTVIATSCLMLLAGVAYAETGWLKGSTDEKIKTLEDLQPGLGTIMMEYSARYTNAYYAAKGGNWGLAGYHIKEAREIQEVGETTRPKRASALKAFESAYLDPLDKAIEAKDFKKFEVRSKRASKAATDVTRAMGSPTLNTSFQTLLRLPSRISHEAFRGGLIVD
jgi:hypothetical protein